MERVSLRGFYISELRRSHDAETQLVPALETVVGLASSTELRQVLQHHLEQTKDHATRLQMILDVTGQRAETMSSVGMRGLISEMQQLQQGGLAGGLLDSALIAYAQRIQHYEIAMYGTLIGYATALGDCDTASQFQTTLEEEKEADRQLTKIGQKINSELASKEACTPGQINGTENSRTRFTPAA